MRTDDETPAFIIAVHPEDTIPLRCRILGHKFGFDEAEWTENPVPTANTEVAIEECARCPVVGSKERPLTT